MDRAQAYGQGTGIWTGHRHMDRTQAYGHWTGHRHMAQAMHKAQAYGGTLTNHVTVDHCFMNFIALSS